MGDFDALVWTPIATTVIDINIFQDVLLFVRLSDGNASIWTPSAVTIIDIYSSILGDGLLSLLDGMTMTLLCRHYCGYYYRHRHMGL